MRQTGRMSDGRTAGARRVLVSFHAHPDDEALLCGGTLARAAAEGHRVVVVTATRGEAGLTGAGLDGAALAERRDAELAAATRVLGVARTVQLGYPDSGLHGDAGGPGAFCRVPVDEAAHRLAAVLEQERADVLTVYDPAGGYGHPDHVAVHAAGVRAAELAGTPVVLEATLDRAVVTRAVRALRRVPFAPSGLEPARWAAAFTAPEHLTHRVDVRPYVAAKRAALAAHGSQQTGGAGLRTVALLARLPGPLARQVLGREWFVERGRPPGGPLLDDVFATVAEQVSA